MLLCDHAARRGTFYLSRLPPLRRPHRPLRAHPLSLPSPPTPRRPHRPFHTASRTHAPPGSFEPLRPPPPASLGAPRPARSFARSLRLLRRLLVLAAVLGSAYAADRRFNGLGATRTLRTLATGLVAAVDYKVNFRPVPWTGGTVRDLHERNARRFADLLLANGGLYLKMGQAIAVQSAALPPEFQRMFARMFDDAPADDWPDVEAVLRAEFGGRSPEDVFGVSFAGEPGRGLMERTARASASVAQVHWARLPDGREVAVKIQKRDIAKQMAWDLWAYKTVIRIYSWWFDLPLNNFVGYISERLRLETDFVNEAQNSRRMREFVEADPALRRRVYIPAVYPELSTGRVLTAEWIEGVKLYDKDAITGRWLGGRGAGSPGVAGGSGDHQLLRAPAPLAVRRELRERPLYRERLKPDRQEWRGPRGTGGLGLSAAELMTTMVDLFSAQIFRWGAVHCDPHPANQIIRRLPDGRPQLVLIDHGLYVYTGRRFRRQYARFWRALLTLDDAEIRAVAADWGIRAPDFFASATLMRPYEGGDGRGGFGGRLEGRTPAERQFEMQQRMKAAIRDVLADESRLPRELLFIGRNMRIVQAINQRMGSPVNRVRIMGEWAGRSAAAAPDGTGRLRLLARYLVFRLVLAASDVAFWGLRIRGWLGFGSHGGMEDVLERRMRQTAHEMGVELVEDVGIFEG